MGKVGAINVGKIIMSGVGPTLMFARCMSRLLLEGRLKVLMAKPRPIPWVREGLREAKHLPSPMRPTELMRMMYDR